MAKKASPSMDSAPGADFQPAERMVITSPEQLKAISDPLRLNILELIVREALTVKQMAKRLDQPPTKLYYHVAELEKAGFVTLVDTRVKSGIIEKYYRTSSENITIDPNLLNAAGSPDSVIPSLLSVIFDGTAKEITRSLAAGLVNLEDLTGGNRSSMVLLRSLFTLPREKVPVFIEKLSALLEEMDSESDKPGPDPVSYGCTIAFYPRNPSENLDKYKVS